MASKTIANLNIKLSAGTAALQQDFSRAAGLAQGFGSNLGSIAAKIGGALAGVFAVGKITSAVGSKIEEIDQLARLSDQVGASIGDMQAIMMAANMADIEITGLTGGLRKMMVTISDAAGGSATAAAALQAVGLSAQQLQGIGPAQQLAAITQGLQGIGDASDRVAVSSGIFGKGNGLNFLSLDSSQILQAAKDVDALGLSMTRADAAKVEEADDAIKRLGMSVGGLVQQLTVALAPGISAAAGAIMGLTTWLAQLDSTTVGNSIKLVAFAAAFGGVLVLIPRIIAGVHGIIAVLRALASAQAITSALAGPAGWLKLAVAAGVAASSVALISTAFDGVAAAADRATAAAGKTSAAVTAAGGASRRGVEFVENFREDFVEDINPAATPAANLRASFQDMGKSAEEWQRKAQQTTEQMMTPGDKLKAEMGDLQALWDQRLITPETFERGKSSVREDYEGALKAQEQISALQKEKGVGAVQAGTSAAFAAVQAGGREMRDMVRGQQSQLAAQKEANKLLATIAANAKPAVISKAEIN